MVLGNTNFIRQSEDQIYEEKNAQTMKSNKTKGRTPTCTYSSLYASPRRSLALGQSQSYYIICFNWRAIGGIRNKKYKYNKFKEPYNLTSHRMSMPYSRRYITAKTDWF